MTQVVRVFDALPDSFPELVLTAEREGFDFLVRLGQRFRDGAYLEDHDAGVFAIFAEDGVIAIGAQTADEYEPSPMLRRIRHFYVHPARRRTGLGRALAGALIQDAFQRAATLRLRATHDLSRAFWDSLGFHRTDDPHCSHLLCRDGPCR